MNKKIILIVIVIVIIALGAGSYFWLGLKQPEKYTGPVEKIIFGVETSLLPSAVWVAENRGYFQEQGLDIEIKEFDSGKNALKTMLNEGGLDMVTVAQTPVMLNSFSRNDYAIIAGMVFSNDDVKMLGRQDKGIKTPSDLKGKKIGTTKGSTGHFFISLFLSSNDLGLSDVEIIDFKATELTPALADGQVDAISTWEPHISNAQKLLGEKAVLFKSKDIFREDFYFVSNEDFIKNHPDALRRFLSAIDKANTFTKNNKAEAINIVSQRLKIDREATALLWEIFEFKLFLDQTILITLEDEARWAIANNLTDATKVPNYLDSIYFDALEKVKPEAVTIIHD